MRKSLAALPLLIFALLLSSLAKARADDQLLFQRGTTFYAANVDGKNLRRLLTIPAGGDPTLLRWAAAPDGRRVAWAVAPAAPPVAQADTTIAAPAGLVEAPRIVYVSDLSGRHRKRLLATNKLRDRQSRLVTQVSVPESADLNDWTLDALAFSADGRSLYLSCVVRSEQAAPGHATFVVDAATGAAVVDAEGRWKVIAPVSDVDARGSLLVGTGVDTAAAAATPPSTLIRPLVVLDLAAGKTTPLLSLKALDEQKMPRYALARTPALAPDNKRIVFEASEQGLWVTDVAGKNYRRITDSPSDHAPRWASDGRQILFVSTRPGGTASDLYVVPVEGGKGTLLLSDVSRFFVVPD